MQKLKKKEKLICQTIKNGNLYLTVKFRYKSNGKDCQYSKTFSASDYPSASACMKAAVAHRDLKRAELLTTGLPIDKHKTVGEVLEDYYEMKGITIGNRSTLNSYYNKYIKEKYGFRNIDEITSRDVQECLNSMRFTNTQNMISRVHGLWNSLFITARRMHLVTVNPVDDVDTPKSKKPVKHRNQRVEQDAIGQMVNYLLTTGRNEADKYNNMIKAYLIMVMYETGIRPAEAYALTRDNVDLVRREIHITQAIGSTDKETNVTVATKTPESVRIMPMSTQCENVIRELMNISRNEYLFADYNGRLLVSSDVSKHMRTVANRLGIDFHLYMLRHNFGTTLVNYTNDIRTTMALMGHKNSDTTIKYVTTTADNMRNAISGVEKSRMQ